MEVRPYGQAKLAGRKSVMEGTNMCVSILTLGPGDCIPWHYHSEITDFFIGLEGTLVLETRTPGNKYILNLGKCCEVPPNVAHFDHGKLDGPAKFLIF